MAFFKMSKKKSKEYVGGRTTQVDGFNTTIYSDKAKALDLLNKLRNTYSVPDAIELLVEEHPDTSMARQMLLSLANQGGNIEFNGGYSKRILEEWEDFCSRINNISSTGLDGLIIQATDNFITRSGIGYEIVVKSDLSDIEDVYLVPPKTLKWKLDKSNQKYIPYQIVNGKEIDLSKANFRWIPFNPKTGKPNGTYLFEPVISAADMQLEFFSSSQTVLYRIGTPRYKFSINKERVIETAPPDVKNDVTGKKQDEYMNNVQSQVTASLRSIGPKNDFITTDDISIDTIGGQSAFFQGIDAYASIIDTQILNALKVLGTLMNRHNEGGSYALSTVEFKTIVDMLEPVQRAIKRMVEDIARVWLQIKGYNATVKYTPNPIEWQTFKDKMEYLLSKQEYYRKAEEYGHISPDEATQKTIGNDSAYTENVGYEYLENFTSDITEENSKEGE